MVIHGNEDVKGAMNSNVPFLSTVVKLQLRNQKINPVEWTRAILHRKLSGLILSSTKLTLLTKYSLISELFADAPGGILVQIIVKISHDLLQCGLIAHPREHW